MELVKEIPTSVPTPDSTDASRIYNIATLYVGDLHPEVTESTLFNKFSSVGPVLSIRVCRDAITLRSLGYAYVNFQEHNDAKRALDRMNFDPLNGKPIRIMWSPRDPATRRPGSGNIFIKNLDMVIDKKYIYDTFSLFGTILACKVAIDEYGGSKGYGFVHFETEEAAQQAIGKVNGTLLAGKKVFVGKFQPRSARMREIEESPKRFTNVFIKNLEEDVDKEKLEQMFSEFGNVTFCAIANDSNGKPNGFGFVAFEEPEQADKAINEMHEKQLEGSEQKLFVCRAMKRSERQAELSRKAQKAERMQNYQEVALYVKNLDGNVDDSKLREVFEKYGTITSCKVMCDENGRSEGYGFVVFEEPEQAEKAINEMNHSQLEGSEKVLLVYRSDKGERQAMAKKRCHGVDLIVKNLDDNVEEPKLCEVFEKYGTITSCKVMRDKNGRSKGFGSICFERPEEARKAVTEMNGNIFFSKPLRVSHLFSPLVPRIFSKLPDIRAKLSKLYMARLLEIRKNNTIPDFTRTPGTGGSFDSSAMNLNTGAFLSVGMSYGMGGVNMQWAVGGGFGNLGVSGGMQQMRPQISGPTMMHNQHTAASTPTQQFYSRFSNEFTIKQILGVGGFGLVFDVTHKLDKSKYAVKRIPILPNKEEEVLREVHTLAQCNHPGIVRYNNAWIEKPPQGWQWKIDSDMLENIGPSRQLYKMDFSIIDGPFVYIQMQQGECTLARWLEDNREPSKRDIYKVKYWFAQIVSAVEYLHKMNFIHRDLKPENILFSEADTLQLCDMGITTERIVGDGLTEASRTDIGTDIYKSPEQKSIFRTYSSKIDIFALGLILIEMSKWMPKFELQEVFDKYRAGDQIDVIVDAETAQFVKLLTQVEPKDRPSCTQMLKHPYLL